MTSEIRPSALVGRSLPQVLPRVLARLGLALCLPAALASALAGAAAAQEQGRTTTEARYGVCGSLDDSCYHAWYDRSSGEEAPLKALIFYYVAPGVKPHENREFGVAALRKLLEANGYEVTTTEDPADMESGFTLRPYDAVIFFNTGRDALSSLGQMALRIYVESGGGFVGIHNAFGTNFNWRWYEGLLGTQLFDHGPRQTATVEVQAPGDVSMAAMPEGKSFDEEEFYNLYPDPRDLTDLRVLMTVDEASMLQGTKGYFGNPGMGAGHPVTWCHYYDGGRAWLTTLGHTEAIFEDQDFLNMVLGGVNSVAGQAPFCQD